MKAVFLADENAADLKRVYAEGRKERLESILEFIKEPVGRHNVQFYAEALKGVEYAFSTWGIPLFTEEELGEYFPALKAVFYAAGSVQHFARPCLNRGIKVFSAWGANAVPVAEWTFAQILLAGKGFYHLALEKDREAQLGVLRNYNGNFGAKIGVIGCGMIGRMVLEKLKSTANEVYVCDPFIAAEWAERQGFKKVGLSEIFSECDVISNHMADNAQTRGLIDYSALKNMKDYATFINTARGRQVVEADLVRALKEKPGRFAVLDVTWPEPPEPDSEIANMRNIIITPHVAGSFGREVVRMADYMTEEFIRFTSGAELRYEITQEMLKTMA